MPAKWELEPPIWTSGVILRWFHDQFGLLKRQIGKETGLDFYVLLSREAAEISSGVDALLTIPHFMGAGAPHWDLYCRMESIGIETRLNIETIEKFGIKLEEIRLLGGGAR